MFEVESNLVAGAKIEEGDMLYLHPDGKVYPAQGRTLEEKLEAARVEIARNMIVTYDDSQRTSFPIAKQMLDESVDQLHKALSYYCQLHGYPEDMAPYVIYQWSEDNTHIICTGIDMEKYSRAYGG